MTAPVLVSHIMTKDVVTFFPEQTLVLAEDVMKIHKFRHLPVIDNDRRLVGLVTQRDLLRARISTLTGLTEEQRRTRQEEVRISQLMTRDLWTVHPETLASHAGQMLADHRYSCLPVVDEDDILCGIVTERDFLKFAIKALSAND
jgi:CBS-domain-containing membrane protein